MSASVVRNVPEALRPLLPELARALEDLLSQARGALERGALGDAAAGAHGLKGACMRFGLEEMGAHAARAEDAALAGNGRDAALALDVFAAALAALGEALG